MHHLDILARAPAADVKAFVDALLPQFGDVDVAQNRTGLVMLPMTEPVQGECFYAGEVLVAEAHVRLGAVEGYAACLGRDLVQALALALLDAALAAGVAVPQIEAFLAAHAVAQEAHDRALLADVAATRVEMETF